MTRREYWGWSCGLRMGHGKDLDYCLAKSRKMCLTREGAEKALKRHFKKSQYCASKHNIGWGRRYQNYGSVARYNKHGKCLEYFSLVPKQRHTAY